MSNRFCFAIVVIAVAPLWGQANSNTTQTADTTASAEDARMFTPPPANGGYYPIAGTAEERSNYLRYGLAFSSAYSDNVLGGITAKPISDVSYSVWPTIALDKTTPRLRSIVTYSPGFTFYQKTSERNEADQNAALDIQYRLSQHVTVSLRDTFQKSSNVFNQPNLVSATPVSGSAQAPPGAVIPPLADRLNNVGNAGITYQYGADSMVGASGTSTYLHYPKPEQVPGLYDSTSAGGAAFYSHRVSRRHYVGTIFQYSRIWGTPLGPQRVSQTEIQTHTVFAFYTVYFKPTFSLSLSGGPQHYEAVQSPLPALRSWSPAAAASLGWQGRHTNLAASYSRTVSGGGGLLGAYDSNSANGSARWQLSRSWDVGVSASYSIYKTLTPLFLLSIPGGHAVFGTASVRHLVGEHLSVEAGYTRLHQSYNDIALVSAFPDANREFISISYQFARPLGR
jgi:hypothetical protein